MKRSTAHIALVSSLGICLILLAGLRAEAQLGFTPAVKKPKEFENRTLRSEKSTDNKFGGPKRFMQNTITHYNYYFNANTKLNEVIDRAKQSFVEDYSTLLPFYNYSLDVTAADSLQLDSISFKAQSGIVLHDVRNDWADDLYLLWGAAYYLRKQYDSASSMFQFINHAFASRENDGYYLAIGSKRDGNSPMSISSKEKSGLLHKRGPGRNDAFIWQIRNHLAREQYPQAASLIQALRIDEEFPDRLRSDLEEVQALYYYQLKGWDSSAIHLEQALPNAKNKQEQARWEFLIAQMYEQSGRPAFATEFYSKASGHATDPVLDVYARLGAVRTNKNGKENSIDENIQTLLKMAHRDKYVDYRDIIYYMAAQMELERMNTDGAIDLLVRSTRYTGQNDDQRNRSFRQLADLSYDRHRFRESKNYYDSLQLTDSKAPDFAMIQTRKTSLARLVANLEIIARQDSLQRLAALPESEQRERSRKLARLLRKQQGLKEEVPLTMGSATAGANTPGLNAPGSQPPPPALFDNNAGKGEWYFYNSNSRQRGNTEFKAKWGTRPNVDNWRRSSAVMATLRNQQQKGPGLPGNSGDLPSTESMQSSEVTAEGLLSRIPNSPEALKRSNDSVQTAMFANGVIYIRELEDCPLGTETLEQTRLRFPEIKQMDELLFNLYYCYWKNGEKGRADAIRKAMGDQFPKSDLTSIVTTGKSNKPTAIQEEPTKLYERVYDLFIEGKFSEAEDLKKKADSSYGKNYWTPQLLYIEAVYQIRQRQDSVATRTLNDIIGQFPGQPLAVKAANLLSVLGRRAQIEEELRNLVIKKDDDVENRVDDRIANEPAPALIDSAAIARNKVTEDSLRAVNAALLEKNRLDSLQALKNEAELAKKNREDSLQSARVAADLLKKNRADSLETARRNREDSLSISRMNRTDSLKAVKARKLSADSLATARRKQARTDSLTIVKNRKITADSLLAVRKKVASDSLALAKSNAAARKKEVADSTALVRSEKDARKKAVADSLALTRTKPKPTDSMAKAPVIKPAGAPVDALGYTFKPASPHYVAIILTKVDPIFVSEARNAFARYNKDQYYNKTMNAELVELDESNRFLLMSPFQTSAEAVQYIDETRPKTATNIIPWLKGGKYAFIVITADNLKLLMESKDIGKYREFLEKNIPGKF